VVANSWLLYIVLVLVGLVIGMLSTTALLRA